MAQSTVTGQPTNTQPQGGLVQVQPSGQQYPMGMPIGGPQYQMGPPMLVNPTPLPQTIPGVPPGLEYLTLIDMVFVRQQIEILEVVSGMHMPNKYDIFNIHGELLFRAMEDGNNVAGLMYGGSNRDFNIMIFDVWGRQVMSLYRPWNCCAQEALTVCSPPGNRIGTVDPQSCCSPEFLVRSNTGEPVFRLQGLAGNCCAWGNVDFKIWAMSGDQVGTITKQYSGFVQEMMTAADNFVVSFPKDLHICMKATLVGAIVLLDFMYFEEVNNRQNNHSGGMMMHSGSGMMHSSMMHSGSGLMHRHSSF